MARQAPVEASRTATLMLELSCRPSALLGPQALHDPKHKVPLSGRGNAFGDARSARNLKDQVMAMVHFGMLRQHSLSE